MPEITEYKISDLTTAAQVDESDFVELSQADENVSGGRISLKATILAIANKIANGINFTSALQTTDKTIVGAINEVAQGGGGGSDVEVTPILTEGTKIATITVNDVDADIYGENTKEELGKLSAEKTATGNPVTLETVNGGMAKSCEVTMNPIQDLHGQSAPYPAGGGKNKLDFSRTGIEVNGITFTYNSDGSVTANGTATATATYSKTVNLLFSADSYLNGSPSIEGCQLDVNGGYYPDTGSGSTIPANTQIDSVRIRIANGTRLDNVKFYPMIRTSGDASFAPYENICPISGRDSLNLTRTGKNVCPQSSATTTSSGALNLSSVGTFGKVKSGLTYTFSFTPLEVNTLGLQLRLNNVSGGIKGWSANTLVVNQRETYTFTATEDGELNFYSQSNCFTASTKVFDNIQLELGSTATAYEPYQGQTHTANLGSTYYGGNLDFTTGKLTIDTASFDLGDLTYTMSASGQLRSNPSGVLLVSGGQSSALCERYKNYVGTQPDEFNALDNVFSVGNTNLSVVSIVIRDSSISDPNDAPTILSGTKLTYKLATPTEITLSEEEIALLKGQNVLSTDGDDISLTYSEMMGIDDVKALIDAEGDGAIDYSTEEAEVPNFTFFGEKVYVKAFTFSNVNIGGAIVLMTAPSYIGHIVKAWMYTTNESGVEFTSFPAVWVHEGNLYINPYYNSTAVTGKIVLYYTKTS